MPSFGSSSQARPRFKLLWAILFLLQNRITQCPTNGISSLDLQLPSFRDVLGINLNLVLLGNESEQLRLVDGHGC